MCAETETFVAFEGRDGSQRISQRLQKQLNSIAADLIDERQVRSRTNHFA